jgi:hypothetical protein
MPLWTLTKSYAVLRLAAPNQAEMEVARRNQDSESAPQSQILH